MCRKTARWALVLWLKGWIRAEEVRMMKLARGKCGIKTWQRALRPGWTASSYSWTPPRRPLAAHSAVRAAPELTLVNSRPYNQSGLTKMQPQMNLQLSLFNTCSHAPNLVQQDHPSLPYRTSRSLFVHFLVQHVCVPQSAMGPSSFWCYMVHISVWPLYLGSCCLLQSALSMTNHSTSM